MRKQQPILEWHLGDACGLDDGAWIMDQAPAPIAFRRRSWKRFLKELIVCAMVVAVAAWRFTGQRTGTATVPTDPVQIQAIITIGSPSITGGLSGAIDAAHSQATLTTQFFVLSLPAKDATVVKAAVAGIDRLYAELRQEFGLEPPGVARKQAFAVEITGKADTTYPVVTSDSLILPSAIFARRPISLGANTDQQAYLRQWLSAGLVREAGRRAEVKIFWLPMMTGLQLAIGPRRGGDAEKRRLLEQAGPWSLAQTQTLQPALIPYYWDHNPLLAQLLAEYIVAAYPCSQIAVLIAGFHEHDSWETLSPAVFGIPASKLEADWQTYLANRDASTAARDNEPASLACVPVHAGQTSQRRDGSLVS